MKIKSVDIDNFRAFLGEGGGHFDFSLGQNVVDFVAVYAPNGFGKTSFIDAIEWSLTNEVSRLNVRHIENTRLSKKTNTLRHFEKPNDPAKVKIITADDVQIVISDVDSKPAIKRFKRNEFHKVSLSQEWISKFLMQDYGSDRFLLLQEEPNFSELTQYYLGIKKLIDVYETGKKTELKSTISKLKESIKIEVDPKITETIESLKKDIAQRGLNLEFPVLKNVNDIKPFYDIIVLNIDDYRAKSSLSNDKLIELKSLFSSSENRKYTIVNYFQDVELLNTKRREKEQLQSLITIKERNNELIFVKTEILDLEWLQNNLSSYQINLKNAELLKKQSLLDQYNTKREKWLQAESSITDLIQKKSALDEMINKRNEFEQYNRSISNDIERLNRFIIEGFLNLSESEVKLIRQIDKNYSDENKILDDINKEKILFQEIDLDLQNIIENGILIVNKADSSNCPLCHQDYDSKDQLLNSIRNSNVIGKQLSNLLEKEQIHKDKIVEILKSYEKEKERLIKFLNEKLNIKYIEFGSPSTLGVIDSLLNELDGQIKNSQHILDDKKILLGSLSDETFITSLSKQITALSEEIITLNKHIELNPEILQPDFKERYESKLTQYDLDMQITGLEHKLNEKIERKTNIEDEVIKLSKLIETDAALIELDKVNLKANSEFLLSEISDLEGKIILFENDFKLLMGDEIANKSKDEIQNVFESKVKDLTMENEKSNAVLISLDSLNKMVIHIETFLKVEETNIEIKKLEGRLNFLELKVKSELIPERDRAKSALETLIEDTLKFDLINNIYKTIDPHPDFKDVKFVWNLDANNPTLDIKVANESGSIFPSLYFSTAQINILSLSIFLANALNSEVYDFILIDDPIQSMDSINILATIDLLRGIVANLDKQIILTTHDFNFYSLLKKKIPRDKFKAKYFAFETFGKVAEDIN